MFGEYADAICRFWQQSQHNLNTDIHDIHTDGCYCQAFNTLECWTHSNSLVFVQVSKHVGIKYIIKKDINKVCSDGMEFYYRF
jgi:hypothetical protein